MAQLIGLALNGMVTETLKSFIETWHERKHLMDINSEIYSPRNMWYFSLYIHLKI